MFLPAEPTGEGLKPKLAVLPGSNNDRHHAWV
jgi:hypothetical protein